MKPVVVLIREKRENINGKNVTVIKPEHFVVIDTSKDFHLSQGIVSKELLQKCGSGKTSLNKEVLIFQAAFSDLFHKIKRSAQIITPKDAGLIALKTGIGKESLVINAGTGSGALDCLFANIVKTIISYDIDANAKLIGEQNAKFLNLNNITFKTKDAIKGFDEEDADLIILDLPNSDKAVASAVKSLKIGGWLVAYNPCIPPVESFIEQCKKNKHLLIDETVELIERSWKFDGKAIRPKSEGIGHTAFLTFARKVC